MDKNRHVILSCNEILFVHNVREYEEDEEVLHMMQAQGMLLGAVFFLFIVGRISTFY